MNKDIIKKIFKVRPWWEYLMYSLIIFGGIGLDQLTKFLAVKYLKPIGNMTLINNILYLKYVENPGAAFGMLKDAPYVFNTFSIITVLAISLYLYFGHVDKKLYSIPLAMIVSGGIGNMIDRLAVGFVVDFIDFTPLDFIIHGAVFNGADSFVCVGAFLLVVALIVDIILESRHKKAAHAVGEGETNAPEQSDVQADTAEEYTQPEIKNDTSSDEPKSEDKQ